MAGKRHSVIFILSEGNKPEFTRHLAEETKNLGSRVLIVSDREGYRSSEVKSVIIESANSRFFSIVCATFIELFVHEMAKRKGREAGVFNHISKITDKEM